MSQSSGGGSGSFLFNPTALEFIPALAPFHSKKITELCNSDTAITHQNGIHEMDEGIHEDSDIIHLSEDFTCLRVNTENECIISPTPDGIQAVSQSINKHEKIKLQPPILRSDDTTHRNNGFWIDESTSTASTSQKSKVETVEKQNQEFQAVAAKCAAMLKAGAPLGFYPHPHKFSSYYDQSSYFPHSRPNDKRHFRGTFTNCGAGDNLHSENSRTPTTSSAQNLVPPPRQYYQQPLPLPSYMLRTSFVAPNSYQSHATSLPLAPPPPHERVRLPQHEGRNSTFPSSNQTTQTHEETVRVFIPNINVMSENGLISQVPALVPYLPQT